MRRSVLGRAILSASLAAIILLTVHYYYISYIHLQLDPFGVEERRVETFDFQDTDEERSCFNGDAHSSSLSPIPKIVHAVWLGDRDLTFLNYLAIRSAMVSLQPDEVKFHHTSALDEDGFWFRKLRGRLTLIEHDLRTEFPKENRKGWKMAHLADLVRLKSLRAEGGIYVDMDVISLRSFDSLLHCERDTVLGHEGGSRNGLCNAVILARKGSPFISRWLESYKDFSKSEWNYHSVVVPKKLALAHPEEVCPLSPTAFFWPTWTKNHVRYMHEPINRTEVAKVESVLATNNGSLFRGQLAYHAWSQVAAEYLQDLTPEFVKANDTLFNVMVRRFVD